MRPAAVVCVVCVVCAWACAAAPNHYKVLGVSSSASTSQIRQAYKKLAKQYHPDKPTGDQAKFIAVSAAHEVLSNKQSRRDYDFELRQPSHGYGAGGQRHWQRHGSPFHGGYYRQTHATTVDADTVRMLMMVTVAVGILFIGWLMHTTNPSQDDRQQPLPPRGGSGSGRGSRGSAGTDGGRSGGVCRHQARRHAPAVLELTTLVLGAARGSLLVCCCMPGKPTAEQWQALQRVATRFRAEQRLRFAWLAPAASGASTLHESWGRALPTLWPAAAPPPNLPLLFVVRVRAAGAKVCEGPHSGGGAGEWDATATAWVERVLQGQASYVDGSALPGCGGT